MQRTRSYGIASHRSPSYSVEVTAQECSALKHIESYLKFENAPKNYLENYLNLEKDIRFTWYAPLQGGGGFGRGVSLQHGAAPPSARCLNHPEHDQNALRSTQYQKRCRNFLKRCKSY